MDDKSPFNDDDVGVVDVVATTETTTNIATVDVVYHDVPPATPAVNPLMVCYFDANDDDDDDDAGIIDDDAPSPPASPSAMTTTTSHEERFKIVEGTDPVDALIEDWEGGGGGGGLDPVIPLPPGVVEYSITSKYSITSVDDVVGWDDRDATSSSSPPMASSAADSIFASDELVVDRSPHDDPASAEAETPTTLSHSALLEAERQAAIAAAISANYHSPSSSSSSSSHNHGTKMMSPSAAAGIARETVRATSSASNTTYQTSGPTIVALPPPPMPSSIPGPYRLTSSSSSSSSSSTNTSSSRRSLAPPSRPVRFDEVRIAFRDRLSSSSSSSLSSSVEKGRSKDGPKNDRGDIIVEGEVWAKMNAPVENVVVIGSATAVGVTPSSPPVDPGEDIVENIDEGGDDAKSKPSSSAPTTSAIHDNRDMIPDSFLKFLLHVARVPLIPEENSSPVKNNEGGQKRGDSTDETTSPSFLAAKAASQRAHDILCMVRCSYESISEAQERIHRDAGRTDATKSFFAACAGLKVADADDLSDDLNSIRVGDAVDSPVNGQSNYRDRELFSRGGTSGNPPLPPPSSSMSSSSSTASMTTASSMASSVFSNVISKMIIPKKQSSYAEMGKKLVNSTIVSTGHQLSNQPKDAAARHIRGGDYEVLIDNEMLGLTVENVLERTIIRTLLPDGAARHAGAQVGSLVAKVGNIDTSNLTHFETIDELRRSQRPLKLTLRHVGGGVLRKAREEMGRLIRGQGSTSAAVANHDVVSDRPWKGGNIEQQRRARGPSFPSETFDSVLNNRWPLKFNKSSTVGIGPGGSESPPPLAMTREERMQQAGKKMIRILALLVVGLVKELTSLNDNVKSAIDKNAEGCGEAMWRSHLSGKELSEAIEISSKILLDFVSSFPDVSKDPSRSTSGGGSSSNGASTTFRQEASSFYPVPPGRVQGKKRGPHPPPYPGRGSKAQTSKKHPASSSLLRIGDALKRSRSFLVELSSVTATALRWEIIDYLCMVLDLDTEQELNENEDSAESSNGGDAGSDLGAAGSILKLIVLNCSTIASEGATLEGVQILDKSQQIDSESESSSLAESSGSPALISTSGNCFLAVVHRLAASKSISARVSACSLGPVLWSHLDFPRQLQLRGVLTRALHDVEVVVRKSTAVVLHEIAELVFDRRAVSWLVLMCERSMTDPEPQLRAAAMTLTWHLAEHLPNAFVGDASKGSRSIRRLPPRDSPTFMDVYLLQCKLFPVANNLAEDRVASVRLSVAAQCDRLCNALGKHWSSVIIDLLQSLLSDSDDLVRSEAVLCIPRLVESVILGTPDSQRSIAVLESLLPLALKIQKDSSSIVRSSLATATGELLIFLVGLGGVSSSHGEPPPSPGKSPSSPGRSGTAYTEYKKYVDDILIPILQKLLQDSDPEVTTASLRAVTNASRSGTARETSSHTRTPSGSLSSFIDDDLVSLSSHHSHHSHASFERTRPVFIPVLSERQVLRLLPTLSNLGTSAQWRVRQSAVEIVPALMGCTHRHETRREISKLCLRLMNDKVDAVRKTAAECFCLGGSSLARHGEEDGGEWINTIVIPHLRTCSISEDGKQRLLSLKMAEIIITNGLCPTSRSGIDVENYAPQLSLRDDESISSSVTESERPVRIILNIAASLTSDKVANVRLNVGRTFAAIMSFLDRSDVEFVVETLEKQLDEESARSGGGDRDVIYFSHQAISMAQPQRQHLRRSSSRISSD